MSKNAGENEFEFIDRKLLPIVSISSLISSIIVVVTSAVKAYLYSDYFGISMSNFDYISTAKEMVLCVGPFLLVVLAMLYFKSDNKERVMVEYPIEKIFGFVFLIFQIALIDLSIYVFLLTEKALNFSKHTKLILVMSSIVFLGIGLFEIFIASKKKKEGKRDTIDICDYLIWMTVLVLLGLTLFPNIAYRCIPSFIKEMETAKSEDKTYAIICDYNEKKIAMNCWITDDKKEIVIYYGEYSFIEPKDYTFKYEKFEEVYCSKKNPPKNAG